MKIIKTKFSKLFFLQLSSILWGEGFKFTSHPINEGITVHLYKGSKKKKDKDYVGLVNINARKIKNSPKFIESW